MRPTGPPILWPGPFGGATRNAPPSGISVTAIRIRRWCRRNVFSTNYDGVELDEIFVGNWAKNPETLPYHLQAIAARGSHSEREKRAARKAFYALCTHIDQQTGTLIGTIRDEGFLDNTIILFTSDHGDMLGKHNLWAKQTFYEWSAGIPMVLVGIENCRQVGFNRTDDRLVGLQDVMPPLLDLAGIDIPESVGGRSMISGERRDTLYGEFGETGHCSRMIRDGTHKLINYPVGNVFQLFDLENDPNEMVDLADDPASADILGHLKDRMLAELYGSDLDWIDDCALVGEPARRFRPGPNGGLSLTRGHQWPVPPINPKGDINSFSGSAGR